MVTDDEAVKSFLAGSRKGRVSMHVKAIISAATTVADGSAGDLIVPQRVPGVVATPQRRFTIRDLLTPGRTDKNAIQYVKETGFTNNAATVSKHRRDQAAVRYPVRYRHVGVSTIAHWVLATKQILDDVPQLQSYIDGRLRYGLQFVEENQLLNGSARARISTASIRRRPRMQRRSRRPRPAT
jgi:HK97 family phage major capsid protein